MVNKEIDQIRDLLDELESRVTIESNSQEMALSGLELPNLVEEIVDLLQPQLTSYQIAFYWHLFRHSIVGTGKQLIRVSTRGLRSGVLNSRRSGLVSLAAVQEGLAALEEIGAIRKDGEPNRDGTLYRILVPNEIEACRELREKIASGSINQEVSESEVDYYNIKENRIKIYERDNYLCKYCEKQLTLYTCTLDHVNPIANGGDNGKENLVTACLDCNSRKNKRKVGDFLIEK